VAAETALAPTPYAPIADYAVIGDCHTAALVSRDGSLDWYCPGRFDGPAVFCRLLDAARGGYWRLAPLERFTSTRQYQGPTNVLQTTFAAAGGQVRVTDFMPVAERAADGRGPVVATSRRVLRLVEGLAGTVELGLTFKPTFDYARAATTLSVVPERGAVAQAAGSFLALACPSVALAAAEAGAVQGCLQVQAGRRYWLALTAAGDAAGAQAALTVDGADAALVTTLDFWERWAARCTYVGPYRTAVLRGALTLKLLTYEPSGALVAAPTTSLPEEIGGVRNWDYRYTWLRDSSLILFALLAVGYETAAADFFGWLERIYLAEDSTSLQIMYTIDGGRSLPEVTLDHLAGYRDSRPVRIGNAAAQQRQLDIYGEVLATASMRYRARAPQAERSADSGGATSGPPADVWTLLRGLVEQAAAHWQDVDQGIWEVRGGPQPFLYSKLMCWVALDQGVRLAEEHGLDAPLDRWRTTREAIRAAIETRGYDATLGAFTQAFGSRALDASALAIPRAGFLPATDPRVRSTVELIRTTLTHNGLVRRYAAPDGLPGGEGAFLMCSFWLVGALAIEGRVDEARALFERLLGYANDVGLFSEEIDPRDGTLLGNFPQGFTHLALINAAVSLARAAKRGAEHEPQTDAQRLDSARRAAAGE
jgi:GH15 family glucan-1,4-alpha-glucosidase